MAAQKYGKDRITLAEGQKILGKIPFSMSERVRRLRRGRAEWLTIFWIPARCLKGILKKLAQITLLRCLNSKQGLQSQALTISEVLANLRRLVDVDKLLDDREYTRLKALFLGDISEGVLNVVEVTTSIMLDSAEIISRRFLTPIDSIQLAVALSINDGELVFVCADDRLCQRAQAEGLKISNPLKQG
ncbi:MAG: type II toxin-antitoxin system VapC family toxin [Firmicutes bacterium]|nr:type II toxin-antitoxin system VapC family toxin [Bacillota bacterium]